MLLVCALFGVSVLILSNAHLVFGQTSNSTLYTVQPDENFLTVVSNTEGKEQTISIPSDELLFNVSLHYDQNQNFKSMTMTPKPELQSFYNQVGFFGRPHDTVFIYPIFTQAAYDTNGFYDYYNKKCDSSCLTVSIPDRIHGGYSSSLTSAFVLTLLNYSYVTDIDVDKNPDILKQYKRVIVLHNEYVTQREFDAITSHPDVLYLYPNSLFAQVSTDYNQNTITLVRGHGYPDPQIRNGFGWKYDNSQYEYDAHCDNWEFYHAGNGLMLNCYPEYEVLFSKDILSSLQSSDPTDLLDDIAYWSNHTQEKASSAELLDDYGISGTKMPSWLSSPATWVLNGQVTKREFGDALMYLHVNNIIE